MVKQKWEGPVNDACSILILISSLMSHLICLQVSTQTLTLSLSRRLSRLFTGILGTFC